METRKNLIIAKDDFIYTFLKPHSLEYVDMFFIISENVRGDIEADLHHINGIFINIRFTQEERETMVNYFK